MSEPTFLQYWLGGAFSHVDGDLDFANADGSAVLTSGEYSEIADFVREHGEVYVDLAVDDSLAGFAIHVSADKAGSFPTGSFSIHREGECWIVYLVDGDAKAIREIVSELQPSDDDVHAIERMIPLPVNDFDVDDDAIPYQLFTIAEIEGAFFTGSDPISQPALADEPTERINDAEIWGIMSDEVANLPIVLSVAKSRDAKEWKTQDPAPFKAVFTGIFSKHVVGKKDGNSIVTGSLGQGSKRRTKNNVLANYMMGLDVDSGASMEETFQRVRQANLTAIFYTTHSHGTSVVEIAYDKFHRWATKEELPTEPTDDLIRRYMRAETNYVSDVCDTAEFVEKRHDDGMKLIARTRPIDKFRILFPLAAPYVYAEREGAHKDVISAWESKVLGMGRSLGVEVDRVARDPSRLFYLPRHGKDSKNHRIMLTCGRLVSFEEIPTASTSTRVTDDPFDQAAHIMGGTGRGRVMSPTLGLDMGQWARDHAHEFDIASLFRDHCPDRIRVEQTPDKLTIECPFDDDHSNPGDPEDPGTFIQSAGMEAETFSFHCSHAGCYGRDRLTFLQKAMQDGWFPDDALVDKAYFTETDDDDPEDADEGEEDEDDGEDDAAYSDRYAAAVKLVSQLSKDAKRRAIDEAYEAVAALRRLERNGLISKLSKQLNLVKADVAAHINNLRAQGAVAIEDETPEPAAMVKSLRRRHPRYKNTKKPLVPVIDGNIAGCIDYFVEQCNGINATKEMLFIYGDNKVRCVQSTNNEYKMDTLSKPVMRSVAHEEMTVVKLSSEGTAIPDAIPDVMAEQAYMSPRLLLHRLDGYSDLPYFTKDGKLVTTAGYDKDGARILRLKIELDAKGNPLPNPYAPERLLEVTHENLALAKRELGRVFCDFPFKDHPDDVEGGQSSRAHLLAMMLHPLVRSMFEGNSPFYLVNKPSAGTGATLLVSTAMRIATGTLPGTVAMSNNDEELRKAITARFISGTNVTFFDNLIQPLNSPHLANLATSDEWEDRVLGQTHMTKVPNRMQVIIAGNNVRTSDENTRRVLPILMDLEDDPTEARDFEIADLKGYVDEHREELFKYLILIVQYWLKHRPVGWTTKDWKGFALPSFEQYCAVMGSILETIGVEGFGGNVKYIKSDNSDRAAWNAFLSHLCDSLRPTKGEGYTFETTRLFKTKDVVDAYINWQDQQELRANGVRTVVRPAKDDDDRVSAAMAELFPLMKRQVFRIMWRVRDREYEETKVRLDLVKGDDGVQSWVIKLPPEREKIAA